MHNHHDRSLLYVSILRIHFRKFNLFTLFFVLLDLVFLFNTTAASRTHTRSTQTECIVALISSSSNRQYVFVYFQKGKKKRIIKSRKQWMPYTWFGNAFFFCLQICVYSMCNKNKFDAILNLNRLWFHVLAKFDWIANLASFFHKFVISPGYRCAIYVLVSVHATFAFSQIELNLKQTNQIQKKKTIPTISNWQKNENEIEKSTNLQCTFALNWIELFGWSAGCVRRI